MKNGGDPRMWALGAGAAFCVSALAFPHVLRPLNLLWFKFGLVLHRVMTPVVMGVLFVTTVVPTGLLMRAFGKDPMRLRRDVAASTYWVNRVPPGPAPESMKNQF